MDENDPVEKGLSDRVVLMAIQRHWLWSDKMRTQFKIYLPTLLEEFNDLGDLFPISDGWVYMSLWYGMMFSVLEALEENKVVIPSIAKDVNKIYEKLRLYRNAVFHVQKRYWPSSKIMPLINDEETTEIVHRIHKEIEAFLIRDTQRILPSGNPAHHSKSNGL